DTVVHSHLFDKLKAYGVSQLLLKWIEAFLIDRTQRVVVDNVLSDPAPVSSVVVQGSCLGPLLFLVYVNDMFSTVPRPCRCSLFADDTKIFARTDSGISALLLASCSNYFTWCDTWQLKLAFEKCSVLHLGREDPEFLSHSL